MTAVDICLCTFRRPQVADTLRSLGALAVPADWTLRVIVADNDDTPDARAQVERAAQEAGLSCTYIHAPARNISVARNACLEAATAPLIAFLDDDEIATPAWLTELVSALGDHDAVLGPVRAVYPAGSPAWMIQGDFHATRPVWVRGRIVTGYTCNVLFRRDALRGLRFRPELGRSGGEDTAFFSGLHAQGGRIAYAPGAWLTEAVTPARSAFSWLLKRRFRSGQTHALLLLERHGAGRLRHLAAAAAKLLYCAVMTLATAASPVRRRFWCLRGALHLGVVARLLGKREVTQYG